MWDLDGKNVLEIGAFTGAQTQIIVKHKINSLTVVEPNPLAIQDLKIKYPNCRLIDDDIFDVYKKEDLTADTVICLGLLYHLHSPFYLLECIANQSKPSTIILDSLHCKIVGHGGLIDEKSNVPGNMYSKRKLVPYAIAFPFVAIDKALSELGYQMFKCSNLSEFKEINQKSSGWIARWQLQ